MTTQILTQQKLKELLDYNPDTGDFTNKVHRNGRSPFGAIAGYTRPDRYKSIRIDRKSYLQHRLAWLYVYGVWPEKHIDHINNDPSDNRILNLRDVTRSENLQNRAAQSNNTSGHKGVTWLKATQKWQAQIRLNNKNIYLGTFDTVELASDAYQSASNKIHPCRPN
jgi:hypothetical protein